MQINIKPSEPVKVQYGEKAFEVSKPKVSAIREFKKRVAACSKEGATETADDVLWAFCEQVGVPSDVLNDWDFKEMSQFFDGFVSDLGEKKT